MAQIHKGYALALFSLSQENGMSDKVYSQLSEIKAIFEDNVDYLEMLSSPILSKNERKKLLSEAFGDKYIKEVDAFLMILCEKGDMKEFFACFYEYERLYQVINNISLANIISATELTDSQADALKVSLEKRTGKKLTLNLTIDKSILGGIIAEIDGVVYDGSIKHRIAELKKVIDR